MGEIRHKLRFSLNFLSYLLYWQKMSFQGQSACVYYSFTSVTILILSLIAFRKFSNWCHQWLPNTKSKSLFSDLFFSPFQIFSMLTTFSLKLSPSLTSMIVILCYCYLFVSVFVLSFQLCSLEVFFFWEAPLLFLISIHSPWDILVFPTALNSIYVQMTCKSEI